MPLTIDHYVHAVRVHGPVVRQFVARRLRVCPWTPPESVNDLVQRAFERAWARLDTFYWDSVADQAREGSAHPISDASMSEECCPSGAAVRSPQCDDGCAAIERWLIGIARLEVLMFLRGEARESRRRTQSQSDLLDLVTLPEGLEEDKVDHAKLRTCLKRLKETDRLVMALHAGLNPDPADVAHSEDAALYTPGLSHTDAEIAFLLQGHKKKASRTGPWNAEQVRWHRRHALVQLSKCLRTSEVNGQLGHLLPATRAPKPAPSIPPEAHMNQKPQSPNFSLPDHILLRLLEEPESQALQSARTRLAESPASQKALRRLLLIEEALYEQASAASPPDNSKMPCEPLPSGLEARLLRIPSEGADAEDMPGAPLTAPSSGPAAGTKKPVLACPPERRLHLVLVAAKQTVARLSRPSSGLALAATVLLTVGAGVLLRSVYDSPETSNRYRGGQSSGSVQWAPLALWVQTEGGITRPMALEPAGPDRWRAVLQFDARVSLRVRSPEALAPEATWRSTAKLWRRTAFGTRTPLELPELEGEGSGADLEIVVGQGIRLDALASLGFDETDVLELEVERAGERWWVELVRAKP